VARDGRGRRGRLWLQYWLFFTDNPQDRGILHTGRHSGDWELLQLRLGRDRRPVEATFAQHTWAEGCDWGETERDSGAPIVYVANGSHALYPRAGGADRPWPDPNDEADGRGRRVRPPVERVSETEPRWMAWPGHWGEDEAGWVPGEQSSPRGPAFQPDRWDDPGRFHAAEARACGAGPPGRPWQTVLTIVLVLVVATAGLRAGAPLLQSAAMIDRDQVLHVARLARLRLSDEELERMPAELSKILEHVERMNRLELEGVEPTSHVVELQNVLREDVPRPCLPRETALRGAPDIANGGFRVPSPGAS
jgi:aspartyl-tRNA(Asn)/glutamyl-tRNA(Gln) amidotransferase subunit C